MEGAAIQPRINKEPITSIPMCKPPGKILETDVSCFKLAIKPFLQETNGTAL
jgi:hypothetical protein